MSPSSSPSKGAERDELERLLQDGQGLDGLEPKARLTWLQRCADAAERSDLGEDGALAAVDLRAALGALVLWTREGGDPAKLGETRALMGALTLRAVARIYRGLADRYQELSVHVPGDEECRQVALAFAEAADAIERGEPVPASAPERLTRVRRSLALP